MAIEIAEFTATGQPTQCEWQTHTELKASTSAANIRLLRVPSRQAGSVEFVLSDPPYLTRYHSRDGQARETASPFRQEPLKGLASDAAPSRLRSQDYPPLRRADVRVEACRNRFLHRVYEHARSRGANCVWLRTCGGGNSKLRVAQSRGSKPAVGLTFVRKQLIIGPCVCREFHVGRICRAAPDDAAGLAGSVRGGP